MSYTNNLHQGQSHDILRSWQSQRNDVNHHKDFVLPMFIGNLDDAVEIIDSMPEVYRYGCNRAVEYLEPLVREYGLRAVLLFPVVTKSDQARLDALTDDSDDENDDISSSAASSPASTSASRSSSSVTSDDEGGDTGQMTEPAEHHLLDEDDDERSTVLGQNPFLTIQSEEETHLLGGEQQQPPEVPPRQTAAAAATQSRASNSTTAAKNQHKSLDAKLIKGMALKDEHNPVLRLIPKLRAKFPELLIICDVCLCAFTSTGHCCLFDTDMTTIHRRTKQQANQFPISNKITCQYLVKLAVEYALRGCNVVAPSDMMDGRVLQIRQGLDEQKLSHVAILSYSAKFASAFYGPFRQATNNAPEFGDRRAYQLPPGSRALALKAVGRDLREGADFIMVKPAGPYLDIVRDIREMHPEVPVAVYQVSGEYSMLKMAAKANLLDLKLAVNETLTALRRAGATIIITYFTPELLRGDL